MPHKVCEGFVISERKYENVNTVFSIGYIKVSNNSDPYEFDKEMIKNENEFLSRLKNSIDPS